MKTLEVENETYLALEKRIQRFGETPNDVIKRLLGSPEKLETRPGGNAASKAEKSPLMDFAQSPAFLRGNAKDRYFDVLRFIHNAKPKEFEKLDGFRRGSRVQISKDRKLIQESGRHTYPEQIDGTPYYASTNLSNERKKAILQDLLRFLGYPDEIVAVVVNSVVATKKRLDLYAGF